MSPKTMPMAPMTSGSCFFGHSGRCVVTHGRARSDRGAHCPRASHAARRHERGIYADFMPRTAAGNGGVTSSSPEPDSRPGGQVPCGDEHRSRDRVAARRLAARHLARTRVRRGGAGVRGRRAGGREGRTMVRLRRPVAGFHDRRHRRVGAKPDGRIGLRGRPVLPCLQLLLPRAALHAVPVGVRTAWGPC